MIIYAVGGAVRDELLGLPVQDRDYVVVGATPEELLAQGFQPVGRDFPVFLHPRTHEEYALARTERKSGHGYHGFTVHAAPDVTLEEDLARRDLTINAIAKGEDGTLVDPHGGVADLRARVLRHVGPAFVEDPVRILRVARFAARFADFAIAPETLALMARMVQAGEADHLVAERVWQEFAKGLLEAQPSRMLAVLRDCGALARLLPEVAALAGVPQRADYHPEGDAFIHSLLVLDAAAARGYGLAVRWAALLHDLGKATTPMEVLPRHFGHEERGAALAEALSQRLKAPTECRELAVLAARLHGQLHQIDRDDGLTAGTMVRVLERADAFRRPERFARLLEVAEADHAGRAGARAVYRAGALWARVLAAARGVDAGAVAAAVIAQGAARTRIPERLHQARAAAVAAALGQT